MYNKKSIRLSIAYRGQPLFLCPIWNEPKSANARGGGTIPECLAA